MNPASLYKVLSHDTRKTWIIPHEAVESFGWTFLGGFDVLKVSHVFRKTPFIVEERWTEKKNSLI